MKNGYLEQNWLSPAYRLFKCIDRVNWTEWVLKRKKQNQTKKKKEAKPKKKTPNKQTKQNKNKTLVFKVTIFCV